MLLGTVVGTLQHKWSIKKKKKKLYYHCFVKWMKESATSGFLLFRENHHLVFYNNTLIGSQKILSSLGDQNKFHNQSLTWKKILIILPNWTQESTVFICRHQTRRIGSWCSEDPNSLMGFRQGFFLTPKILCIGV